MSNRSRTGGRIHGHLADMSLPPEQRGRKRKAKGRGKGATAQMNHGSGSKGRRWRREWAKKDRGVTHGG